jgi:hypothetical protein
VKQAVAVRGKPNLLLLHQLYWTVVGAFFFMGVSVILIIPLFQGSLEDSPHTMICMLQPAENMNQESGVMKSIFLSVWFSLAGIYGHLISTKVRKFVFGICPNGHMAAIGMYRRNLIDFEENSRFIFYWAVYGCLVMTVRKLSRVFPGLSPVTVFWMSHCHVLLFVGLLHGIVLPLRMEIPWRPNGPRKMTSFYVHEPKLPHSPLPRSPRTMSPPIIQSSLNSALNTSRVSTENSVANSSCFAEHKKSLEKHKALSRVSI